MLFGATKRISLKCGWKLRIRTHINQNIFHSDSDWSTEMQIDKKFGWCNERFTSAIFSQYINISNTTIDENIIRRENKRTNGGTKVERIGKKGWLIQSLRKKFDIEFFVFCRRSQGEESCSSLIDNLEIKLLLKWATVVREEGPEEKTILCDPISWGIITVN